MSRGIVWGAIISIKALLIVTWLSLYIFMEGLWDKQFIYRSFWSNFYLKVLCTFLLFLNWNWFYSYYIFLGAPVNDGTIKEVIYWYYRASVRYIYFTNCIKICVEEVGVYLVLLISASPALKKHWYRISFVLIFFFLEYMMGSC